MHRCYIKSLVCNVNGIRAAEKKGFVAWLEKEQADIVCLQETKAQMHRLPNAHLQPKGYYAYYHDAQKPGYSGVALFCKQKPLSVEYGLGWPCADEEGRYVQANFSGFSVASIYVPSGTSGDKRQALKMDFLARLAPHLSTLKHSKRPIMIAGDWNIAHTKKRSKKIGAVI